MRDRQKFFLLVTGLLSFTLVNLSSLTFAQSTDREKSALKDFGSSLKHKKDTKTAGKTKQNGNPDEDLITIKTDFVVNDVLVLDEKGLFVRGLTKEDFIVTENGEPQEIQMFSLGDDAKIPRSIILLIDHSRSERFYINDSVDAAKVLIDNLNSNDRMAIVTDNIELLCDFTRDKQLLKEKLDSLKLRVTMGNYGQSRQYTALLAALNELFSPEDVRRIVIFQTDGDQINIEKKKFDFDEVMKAIEKSRSTIYSIIPGPRYLGLSEKEKFNQSKAELKTIAENSWSRTTGFDLLDKPQLPERRQIEEFVKKVTEQQSVLTQIAGGTGGWADYLDSPSRAKQIYPGILESINKRYVIGYYPKNEIRDGKRRNVKIEVRNHPEYQVEGRKTYFAAEPEN